jgi:hypothetical protein
VIACRELASWIEALHAAKLMVVDADPPRCARFDEFSAILRRAREDDPTRRGMARFAHLVDGTSPGRDPVFWSRIVAYGYIANWFLPSHRPPPVMS